jgi:hypothetical protein
MIVTLPTQLETWVSSQIQDGVYVDANEVLVKALELLKFEKLFGFFKLILLELSVVLVESQLKKFFV